MLWFAAVLSWKRILIPSSFAALEVLVNDKCQILGGLFVLALIIGGNCSVIVSNT